MQAPSNQTTAPSLSNAIQRNHNLLTECEAAAFLDCKPGSLGVWRSTGRYNIPFVKIGSKVRYRKCDLEAWLESRTRNSGATP